MIARATAPNRLGPSTVFPDAAKWDFSDGLKGRFTVPFSCLRSALKRVILGSPMAEPMFWIALICQLIVVVGYFFFYRKEQLGMSYIESIHRQS